MFQTHNEQEKNSLFYIHGAYKFGTLLAMRVADSVVANSIAA
jgi:hypothetical protein